MLVHSAESRKYFDEYNRVFGKIDSDNKKQSILEKKAMSIMREMRRMDFIGKKIEQEGKRDKIENFNNRYIKLKIELVTIFENTYAKN